MLYTFTEKELKCFLDWASPAACELGLNDFEVKLCNKLNKILNKTFDEMSNFEKITDFTIKCGYPCYINGEYLLLRKEGKEEKRISSEMNYKDAVKEIVYYYED